jgi:hypothetical protein
MPACDGKLFAKFKRGDVFIETGTYCGEGIEAALKAGFSKIYSIELSEEHFDFSSKKFVDAPEVVCLLGDSREHLQLLAERHKDDHPLFWLDAHFSGGTTAKGESEETLLNDELDGILSALGENRSFSVLIDDMYSKHFEGAKTLLEERWSEMVISHEDGCGGESGNFSLMPNSVVVGDLNLGQGE